MKIGVVIPYFGSWPSYFDFFLKGCEANQWIDIIFFTDCPTPEKYPSNVYFKKSSLKEVSILASDKLGFSLKMDQPYKLCDLKPFYGMVFEDFLRDYHFWGYGDIDLIYGDLKSFVLPRIETGFDILSSRKELLSGSFALFRNVPTINQLCTQIPNYSEKLQSKKYECIDETAHSNIVWQGGSITDLPNGCFTKVVYEAAKANIVSTSFQTICKEHIGLDEVIRYERGLLHFEHEHLAYYHYVINKNNPVFKIPSWKIIPDKFFITYSGFYRLDDLKYFTLIKTYRSVKGKGSSLLHKAAKKLKRELTGIIQKKQ